MSTVRRVTAEGYCAIAWHSKSATITSVRTTESDIEWVVREMSEFAERKA